MSFKHNYAQKPRHQGAAAARRGSAARKALLLTAIGVMSLTGCGLASPSNNGSAAVGSNAELAAASTPLARAKHSPKPKPTHTARPKASAAPTARPTVASPAPTVAPSASQSPTSGTAVSTATPTVASSPAPAPTSSPATAASPAAPAPAGDGTQAAVKFGWGSAVAGDEFSYTGAPDSTKWSVYNSAGHAGNGTRTPKAWSVANGMATVSGDAEGNTGGMSAKFAQQQYGRWETRMRTNARDPQYHPVLILWPNNNASSKCAEIDYAESTEATAQMKFFLHYACGGSDFQTTTSTPIDTTQWHNYAVEWTPSGITGYIDGVKTFTDTNPAHQPGVGMHQTLQLDWFPNGGATSPSQMQVDWVRVYK
ncbi:glycoside hydrolase family 16 protein [Arthrobacter dokdonensis]|uniref:glycoside hydrolase family 16 protein n=1 Tax=Arthrobacter dokdonellae TaxID=2211210 RepID=UPI001D131CEC|nr:glycoside hydrolase family 16 protein [Arthrobacter dokdonellae]